MTGNKTVAQTMTAAEHAVAGILLTTVGARDIAELARTIVAAVQAVRPATEPAPDRNDIYVRALNVMRGGLRTEQIDDSVIVDWWTDSLGVEHVAGVEVLYARGVEVNGVDIAKGRAHSTGPAVARPDDPERTTFGPCPACDQDFDVCKGLAERSSATCCDTCAEHGRHRTHARTTQEA